MAVANTKSNIVANADATPRVITPLRYADGDLKEAAATVETAAADDAGSVYRLFRVRSSWRIAQLLVGHDAITGMSTADIGVYDTAENGGAVVSVNLFASAIDMTSASAGLVDRTYEATAANIAKVEQALWQMLGLSADPMKEYDIAVTATTNDPSVALTISALLRYVNGN
jgi:hypothetical protein